MALAKKRFRNRSGRRSEQGTAAIEFAMFLPLLVIMITGTAELGHSMYEAMQVYNAAEAGMLWAANPKNAYNAANITTAATSGSIIYGSPSPLTVAPSQFCGCPAATGITNLGAPPCSATACAGSPAGTYVQVVTTLPHRIIVDLNTLLAALTGGAR